jgi:hypothetical protein
MFSSDMKYYVLPIICITVFALVGIAAMTATAAR